MVTKSLYVILCLTLANSAQADFERAAQTCVDFHQQGEAAFGGWASANCDRQGCVTGARMYLGQGDMAGWAIQTMAKDAGPQAGQRLCNLLDFPDAYAAQFAPAGEQWISDQESTGKFWRADRFLYGCGADNQAFTFALTSWDGQQWFSSSMIPGMHPACDGKGGG